MKKIVSFLLLMACLLALGGCKASVEQKQVPSNDIQEPYFTGKVLEKYEDSCLVEVTDIGNGNFAVGQEIVVHMNVLNCPDYEVGDSLTIVFDGKVTCSLPPQIVCVSILSKNESENRGTQKSAAAILFVLVEVDE